MNFNFFECMYIILVQCLLLVYRVVVIKTIYLITIGNSSHGNSIKPQAIKRLVK